MKTIEIDTSTPTLQDVLDRLFANDRLRPGRKRDFRSAVVAFTKLKGLPAAVVPLKLADIRDTLDSTEPAKLQVSDKRWANLRSDLAAAVEASGLVSMFKTADVTPSQNWKRFVGPGAERRIRFGLSRFIRWATLRGIEPWEVDEGVITRFVADLEASTLVRNLGDQRALVAATWNRLVALHRRTGLRRVSTPTHGESKARVPWETLPASFRSKVEKYLAWAAMPDPLDEGARARALAPKTLRLRREQIHSAVNSAVAAGIPVAQLTSLAALVDPETFKLLLRQRWQQDGRELTAYTHGVAGTLIAIATEWLKLPAEAIAILKGTRRKLGSLPAGLTEKNRTLLRTFGEPRLQRELLLLSDKMWRVARRELATSRRSFISLQTALALDVLIHAPMRMENLAKLEFARHVHWPQGRGKPALIILPGTEVKNDNAHEVELPKALSDRLRVYREEIVPKVTGTRPAALFVTWAGTRRSQGAITVAIEKAVLRHLGVKLTPHQLRHLSAKIILDANPGAYELVRQVLGHKNIKTTTNFYAGVDTLRAGRAHADLVNKLRNEVPNRRSRAGGSRHARA
jgi:integrase